MADRSDALRKLRACLALAAAGSGATEPERATARAMAGKLMAAYGLQEGDATPREVDCQASLPPPFVSIFVGGLGRFSFSTQSVFNDGWAWDCKSTATTGGW